MVAAMFMVVNVGVGVFEMYGGWVCTIEMAKVANVCTNAESQILHLSVDL